MSFVVWTNGTCVSFKSVLAVKLSQKLKVPLVASYFFGRSGSKDNKAVDKIARKRRHDLFFQEAERAVKLGKSVVLDGASSRKRFRQRLYKTFEKCNMKEVVIFRTVCYDLGVVKTRLQSRKLLKDQVKKGGDFMDLNFHHKENYFGTLFHEDTPFEDVMWGNVKPAIVYFDSAKLKVIAVLNPNKASTLVKNALLEVSKSIVPDKVFLEKLKKQVKKCCV